VKFIFVLILVLFIFKHTKHTMRKNCVDMCARHGRGAIEICLSEKRALAKKKIGKHWSRRRCTTNQPERKKPKNTSNSTITNQANLELLLLLFVFGQLLCFLGKLSLQILLGDVQVKARFAVVHVTPGQGAATRDLVTCAKQSQPCQLSHKVIF